MTDIDHTHAGEVQGLVDLARGAMPDGDAAHDDEWQIDRLTRAQQTVRGARASRPFVWGISGVAVVAAGVLLVILWPALRAPVPPVGGGHSQSQTASADRLSFVVQGQAPAIKGYLFSDGTTISTSEGGTLQILDTQSRRPRMRVTQGVSHARVVHHPDTHWTFAAGPFDIDVVGTEFDLGWDPALSALTLRLREGVVELRAPTLHEALRVRAGQTVSASARTGRVSLVDDVTPSPTANPPSATTTTTINNAHASQPPISRAPPEHAGGGPGKAGALASWRTLVARGQFDQVIAEARARPLRLCVSACSSEDLRALGDAARYSNRPNIAERAFRALRQRFSGTSDGIAAAFLLGRTYESKRQWEQASRWYARYLAEAIEGEFAVEAAAGRARVANDMH